MNVLSVKVKTAKTAATATLDATTDVVKEFIED